MSGPRSCSFAVLVVVIVAFGGWGACSTAFGAPDHLSAVSSNCMVHIRSVALNVPDVPAGASVLGEGDVRLSLRVSRRYGGWEYLPDEPLGSLDAARRATLWAPGDVPSTVRLTVSWLYMTADSSTVFTTPSRTVAAAILPHGCTNWLVREQGVLATGVSWTTSSDGRRRTYGLRVRCSPAFRLVTVRDQVSRRLLATGRCNHTIRLSRPAAEVTHPKTAKSPFPLAYFLQAASSRSPSAKRTELFRCGSILPLKTLRPPHGRMRLLLC